jgi:hypothetical protein
MSRLLSDITKYGHQLNLCLRCFGHFENPKILARHKQLCTREDFMSVLYILPKSELKEFQIKFKQYSNTSHVPFVIYADLYLIHEKVDNKTNVLIKISKIKYVLRLQFYVRNIKILTKTKFYSVALIL